MQSLRNSFIASSKMEREIQFTHLRKSDTIFQTVKRGVQVYPWYARVEVHGVAARIPECKLLAI